MSKYIVKYSRGEAVKYISHLDFIRVFYRACRRAGLTLEYSSGFNPRPQMTVAVPLSVGVTADNEILKIGILDDISTDEIKELLNEAMPNPDFCIKTVVKTEGKEHDITAIDSARYTVICDSKPITQQIIDTFLNREDIIVPKKSKSGVKDTDIKDMIKSIKVMPSENKYTILSILADCGNKSNLKPDTIIDALNIYYPELEISFYKVNRDMLLTNGKEII